MWPPRTCRQIWRFLATYWSPVTRNPARQSVIDLIESMGMRGFHAGLINNAAAAEALTSILININKQYKTHAGLRLTGID